MRCRIESKVTENGDIRKTEITQTQYITIGDIIGKGKSAAGAVKDLANNLPKAIHDGTYNGFDGNNEKLSFVNGIVQPLAVIISGMEAYRSMAGVIDIMTPIMKTIARSTGIWCSPGNISDLMQIGIGTAQQILISVITSAILNLKELIWNYEITINEMTTELSEKIVDLLNGYNKEHKDDRPSSNPIEEIENEKNKWGQEPKYDFEKDDPTENAIDDLIDRTYPNDNNNVGLDLDEVLDFIETNQSNKRKDDLEKTKDYKTKYPINDTVRMLRGSLSNKGIYYSDDDGKTWTQSNQIDHSFNCFAKVPREDGGYRYLAGSTHTVEEIELIDPSVTQFEKDAFGCYSKDYYNIKKIKYPKYKKDDIEEEGFEKNKNNLYNRKEDDAVGIYYSDDNGITWIPSKKNVGSYELFYEFESKYGYSQGEIIPYRVVASSYDYKGVIYSQDGETWFNAKSNVTKEDITTGRWVYYTSFDNELNSFVDIGEFNSPYVKQKIRLSSDETTSLGQIGLDVAMNYNVVQGLEKINPENVDLIHKIIRYLHDNFPDNIPKLSHERWYSIIIAINDGSYTMEDAKVGRDLEPDWDPETDDFLKEGENIEK